MTKFAVAQTIVSQIMSTDKWALGAWGVSQRMADENSLYLMVRGSKFKGLVSIVLEASDTYTVTAYKADKSTAKTQMVDVYAEDLVNILDEIIGK